LRQGWNQVLVGVNRCECNGRVTLHHASYAPTGRCSALTLGLALLAASLTLFRSLDTRMHRSTHGLVVRIACPYGPPPRSTCTCLRQLSRSLTLLHARMRTPTDAHTRHEDSKHPNTVCVNVKAIKICRDHHHLRARCGEGRKTEHVSIVCVCVRLGLPRACTCACVCVCVCVCVTMPWCVCACVGGRVARQRRELQYNQHERCKDQRGEKQWGARARMCELTSASW
jgi:hypothetical protein